MIDIQGRELYLDDFIMDMFKTGLCLDAYEAISFKLGVMIGTQKSTVWYHSEGP